MRNITLLALILLLSSCATNKDDTGQWVSIFNGTDLTGWTVKISGYPVGENYNETFIARDGVLKADYTRYDTFNGEFGHIFYNEPLSSYKLRLKYRFTGQQVAGGAGWAFMNSGVMLHCQDPATMGIDQDFPVSIEAQFLGGDGTTERSTLNLCTPGTNVVINDTLIKRHCSSSSSKTFNGNEWVTAEVVVYADSIIHHIVNGDTVITYTKPQIDGGDLPPGFDLPDGTPLDGGYISLQAESHPCEYKEIEILRLK